MPRARTLLGATALLANLAGACSEEPSEFEARGGSGGSAAGAAGANGGRSGGSGGGDTGGSTATGGVGATSAGSGNGVSGSAGAAGGTSCNTLENTAELVTGTLIDDDPQMPPTPEGGALVDGIYAITAVDIYDSTGTATVDSRRRTVELRYGGTIWDSVTEQNGVEDRIEAFYEASGTDLLVTTLCTTGLALAPRYGYTAGADRILTFSTDNVGRVTVTTFTLRR